MLRNLTPGSNGPFRAAALKSHSPGNTWGHLSLHRKGPVLYEVGTASSLIIYLRNYISTYLSMYLCIYIKSIYLPIYSFILSKS